MSLRNSQPVEYPPSTENTTGGSVGCEALNSTVDQRGSFAAPTHPSGPSVAGGFYDVAEALTNAAIGLLVSLLLTWLWLGFTPIQSAGITAVFFIASTVRGFIIRRCFRWVS